MMDWFIGLIALFIMLLQWSQARVIAEPLKLAINC